MIERMEKGYRIIKRSIKNQVKPPRETLKKLGITPKIAMVWFLHKRIGFLQREIAKELKMSESKVSRIYKKANTILRG